MKKKKDKFKKRKEKEEVSAVVEKEEVAVDIEKEKDAEEKAWDAAWEAKKKQNEATTEYRKSRGTNDFLDNLQKVQKTADDFIKAHSAWEAEAKEKQARQNIYCPAD